MANEFGENRWNIQLTTHIGVGIVGEIHLDFIGVSYTKDSFEKTQYNWQHAVEVIRGLPLGHKLHHATTFK